ncbi:predicted protein [Botrytis cinerea T4]|uniref:Uncharacterized protein n=1 Tax=Botryotinia fuckeliana (strain T4) TaxID=999810 RepID=G2YD56_BOTF4|nr:predicted protein [Botrytis cinerea T4]
MSLNNQLKDFLKYKKFPKTVIPLPSKFSQKPDEKHI